MDIGKCSKLCNVREICCDIIQQWAEMQTLRSHSSAFSTWMHFVDTGKHSILVSLVRIALLCKECVVHLQVYTIVYYIHTMYTIMCHKLWCCLSTQPVSKLTIGARALHHRDESASWWGNSTGCECAWTWACVVWCDCATYSELLWELLRTCLTVCISAHCCIMSQQISRTLHNFEHCARSIQESCDYKLTYVVH